MAVERYDRFNSALVTWLRTSADLVSLTGHTNSDRRIAGMYGDDSAKTPFCGVHIVEIDPTFILDLDKVIYDTLILCQLRSASGLDVFRMVAAIEDLAAFNSSEVEASFTGTNLRTQHIKFFGNALAGSGQDVDAPIPEVIGQPGQGVRETKVFLRILWREDS